MLMNSDWSSFPVPLSHILDEDADTNSFVLVSSNMPGKSIVSGILTGKWDFKKLVKCRQDFEMLFYEEELIYSKASSRT